MTRLVDELARAAGQAANAGRWEEAERKWSELNALDPRHAQALFSLGVHAMQRDDLARAEQLLTAAVEAAPRDLLTLLTLAAVLGRRGDTAREMGAIEAALAVDPYFLPAMLAKATALEGGGRAAEAAVMHRHALTVAPPEPHWPPMLRNQLAHARSVTEYYAQRFKAHLTEQIGPLQAELSPPMGKRWTEAVSIMARCSKPYHSDSNQLFVPRLPAVPFFDRADFPWAAAIESKTAVIRAELLAALDTDKERFSPYIAYRPGQPVNQWKELNHSQRWSAFHLWRAGQPVLENLARCPETAKALAEVEMADIGGLCPNAMFSALAPHTQIPPHHGETNARLVVHLPLIVPEGCRYRVGFEHREWTVGELLIFDDTIEHEARNDSDELRVVLIFDVWNPLLTAQEREMVRQMAAASRSFTG